MLSLDNEEQVEHTGIQFGVVLMLHHVEEVLCDGEVLTRVTNMQASSLHRVTIDVVCVGNDGWELGDQLDALTHQVVRIWVEGVHLQDATSQDVHDVATLQLDDMSDGTMIKRHVVVQEFLEGIQLLLVWQLTREQEECHLLKTKTLLLQERSNEVVQLVTTIIKLTLGRAQLAIGITLITHDVTDIGQTDQHTGAILITKTTLHIELLECLLIYLA